MTTFFQSCQFDVRGKRLPGQDSCSEHTQSPSVDPAVHMCEWGGAASLTYFQTYGRGQWLVETISYRRGSRKVGAQVTKGGWLRDVHSKLLNPNRGHKMMSRRCLGVWERTKEIGTWNVAFRSWFSVEGSEVHLSGQEVVSNPESS